MKCEEVKKSLEAFHDKSIDLPLENCIRDHLAICTACGIELNCLRNMSRLLQESSIPAASAVLDEKIFEAFQRQHKSYAKPAHWRQKIFTGSISIPKPVFAAALILIAACILTANLIGRNSAMLSDISQSRAESAPVSEPAIISPAVNTSETIKIVEVPAIEERLVTKVVYIERQNKNGQTRPVKARDLRYINAPAETPESSINQKRASPDLRMSGEVAENGYFTPTDLTGFEPVSVIKTKITRGDKINEK